MPSPRSALACLLLAALPACGSDRKDEAQTASADHDGTGLGAEVEGFSQGVGSFNDLAVDDQTQAYCAGKNLGVFVRKATASGSDYLVCLGNWDLSIKGQAFKAVNLAFQDTGADKAMHYAAFFTYKSSSSTEAKPDFGVVTLTSVESTGRIYANYVFGYGGEIHIDVKQGTKGVPWEFADKVEVSVASFKAGKVKPVGADKQYDVTFTEVK